MRKKGDESCKERRQVMQTAFALYLHKNEFTYILLYASRTLRVSRTSRVQEIL